MLVFWIGLALVVAGIFLLVIDEGMSDTFGVIGGLFVFLGPILILVHLIVWNTAVSDTKLINKTYGTSYTTEEMFWSSGTIKEIFIGESSSIELKVRDKE